MPEPITPEPVEPQQGEPADTPLGPNGEKALESERQARKAADKAVTDLTARLAAIDNANLSELEKAQREATDARTSLAELTKQNTRNSVALAKGVPADLVEFLTGDTAEEIGARADLLLTRLNAPTTPRPDPSQGPSGDGSGAGSPAQQFAEFIRTARGQ